MSVIVLNCLLGILVLIISWNSTKFQGRNILHIVVVVLVIGIAILNGFNLSYKNTENLQLKQGQNNLSAKIDTLSQRLGPFIVYAEKSHPDKDIDEALVLIRTELDKRTKPRVIESEKMNSLIDELKSVSSDIRIEGVSGDTESLLLI